jgi:DNA replication factor GINS
MMDLDELRSAQSRERQASQLQHLRDGFYDEAASFIRGLRTERERAAENSAYDFPYDDPEVQRLTDEIGTAEEVVESLYERRVGKVVKMASFDAAGMAVDAEGLTAEESDLFAQLVGDIEANRSRVLDALAGTGGDDGSAAAAPSGTAAAGSTPGIPDEAGPGRTGAPDPTGASDAPADGEPPARDDPVHIGNEPAADGPVSTADDAPPRRRREVGVLNGRAAPPVVEMVEAESVNADVME